LYKLPWEQFCGQIEQYGYEAVHKDPRLLEGVEKDGGQKSGAVMKSVPSRLTQEQVDGIINGLADKDDEELEYLLPALADAFDDPELSIGLRQIDILLLRA